MSEGDYMQADRIRYEGHMCSVRSFTSKRSVLFGMSKSENTTSNLRVGYICPSKYMESVCVCVCVVCSCQYFDLKHLSNASSSVLE